MGRRLGATLGLLVLLSACSKDEPPVSPELRNIRERVKVLLPDIEKELGYKFRRPVDVVVSTDEELAKVVASECENHLAGIEGGLRGDDLAADCKRAAEGSVGLLLGKVELDSSRVHICPDHFGGAGFMKYFTPKWMTGPEMLDIVLIHELVHVYQIRALGAARLVGQPATLSDFLARAAVLDR